jgi:hypothetical protein
VTPIARASAPTVREADVVEAGLREPALHLLGHGQAGEHRGEREVELCQVDGRSHATILLDPQ